jgi:hypothetical protein
MAMSTGIPHSGSSTEDVELALQLADAADALTTALFRAADLRFENKPDRTPVTDADLAVEDKRRELVGQRRPRDTVVGEERGGSVDVGRSWLIDPIDGTQNFLRGVPVWATLIALPADGYPRVGRIRFQGSLSAARRRLLGESRIRRLLAALHGRRGTVGPGGGARRQPVGCGRGPADRRAGWRQIHRSPRCGATTADRR